MAGAKNARPEGPLPHPRFLRGITGRAALNALCGGARLEDIEARRNDRVFLDGLGAAALPDPTKIGRAHV